MKKLLKSLIPPLLWSLIRNRVIKESPSITYEGIYKSFEEVFKSYQGKTTNYNSPESIQASFLNAQERFKDHKLGIPPKQSPDNSRRNLFPTFLSTQKTSSPISILDIGGGLGISYLDLKHSCPHLKIDYTVFELPETIKQGDVISTDLSDLSFVSKIPQSKKFDCILFGSSLQYFENYSKIIDQVCEINPDYILLTDHPMGHFESFVCAQVNMKDRVIPRFVFNINEIIEQFSQNKYQLILKSLNYYPFHNFENYDGAYANAQHHNLGFKKITNNPLI